MRRRRRRRGTWLPPLGHIINFGEDTVRRVTFRIGGAGQYLEPSVDPTVTVHQVFPIVPDFTTEVDSSGTYTLRDQVQGQAWQLNRLVGKIHLQAQGPQNQTGWDPQDGANWPNCIVTAGFFVAPVDSENIAAQFTPMMTPVAYDPTQQLNSTNPWIWRRTWMLSNPAASFATDQRVIMKAAGPLSNAVAPSSLEGQHIDSKVKRFINREHRLFLVVAVNGWDSDWVSMTAQDNQQMNVAGLLDVRIYGTLRAQRNQSSF